MKLSHLLILLSIFTINYACSDTDSDELPDDNSEIIIETPKEVEEEEEIVTDKITIIDGIKYGPDFLVFEPEITKSDLGKWVKRTPSDSKYYKGTGIEALNKNYLETLIVS